MSNYKTSVLYTGVTNNLIRRVYEHKNKLIEGFTKRYCINKLVYFEQTANVQSAIAREKQIKGGSRDDKYKIIKTINPQFKDLYNKLLKQ